MNVSGPIESCNESAMSEMANASRKNQKTAITPPHGNAIVDRFFKTICLFVGFANLVSLLFLLILQSIGGIGLVTQFNKSSDDQHW